MDVGLRSSVYNWSFDSHLLAGESRLCCIRMRAVYTKWIFHMHANSTLDRVMLSISFAIGFFYNGNTAPCSTI